MTKLLKSKFNRLVLLLTDTFLVFSVFSIFNLLEFHELFLTSIKELCILILIISILGKLFGIYDSIPRYFNYSEFLKLTILSLVASISLSLIFYNFSLERILILFFILISVKGSSRLLIRFFYDHSKISISSKVLIYGIDDQSVHLKRYLNKSEKFTTSGFVTPDQSLMGRKIDGLNVYYFQSKDFIETLVNQNIEYVFISTSHKSELPISFFEIINQLELKVYHLPPLESLLTDDSASYNLKKIQIEDLLRRPEIELNFSTNRDRIEDKVVLVTGGAGSIGSEIVRQLIELGSLKILVVDFNESALFNLRESLGEDTRVEYHLIDVTNYNLLKQIFLNYEIDIIYHAAAYKHVTFVEENTISGLFNNVVGTYNSLLLSREFKVESFVLVSTDKAVNPTNIMGVSKRLSEILLNSFANDTDNIYCRYLTTRFGNVLASNGSVVPIFERQIKSGGPITLRHEDVTRYFMTIPEASRLVIEASLIGNNNEVFVFDMGEPVRIMDLAKNMIILTGLRPNIDIKIDIVGLRPGEKLFEEILLNKEELSSTSNKKLFIAKREVLTQEIKVLLNQFVVMLLDGNYSFQEFLEKIIVLVPEYKTTNPEIELLIKNNDQEKSSNC